MKKKLLLLLFCLFCIGGLIRASVAVHLSCGETVTTVDWTYFGNVAEWKSYLFELDDIYCGD